METQTISKTTRGPGRPPKIPKVDDEYTPPQPGEVWTNPLADPDRSNAEIEAVLAESSKIEFPVIDLPADDFVKLPGGILKNGQLHKTAEVRELTGEDEESLARASQSSNPFHFLDRLIKCGVVRIGDLTEAETEAAIPELLVGDRETLILGIRRATYGDEFKVERWNCPKCGVEATLEMEIDNIPSRKVGTENPDHTFDVKLRKGGHVTCHLATGTDQLASYEKENLTTVERQTIILSKCVETYTEPSGVTRNVVAFPSLVRKLSVPDRHEILKQLEERQPGPRFNQIEHRCATCGESVTVALGIGDLFPDIGWF